MGIDAYGWVEVKDEFSNWLPLMNAVPLMDRSRTLFGSLFWTDNNTNFQPIAPERGLPVDCSELVRKDFATLAKDVADIVAWGGGEPPESPEEYFCCTWITWREIQAIDWEEEAPVEPYHIWVVTPSKAGTIQTHREIYLRSELIQRFAFSEEALDAAWKDGRTWEVDGKQYQILRPLDKRKEALTQGWRTLFKVMEVLAEQYGADNVRLIVWFE